MAERFPARVVVGTLGVVMAAATVGVIGAAAVGAALARRVVTPSSRPDQRVVVESIEQRGESALVWLHGPDAGLLGDRYSFLFGEGSGHARLGAVRERRGSSVARELLGVDRGQLEPGTRGRVTGWWFTDPEELGLRTESISYDTELGPMDAWVVHPRFRRKKRWAVHVHGRGASREETLRGIAPLARAGITSLVISYRNDAGAPAGEGGRYGSGVSESRDVDAAIAEAVSRGAERVTLFGWSMGGTACLVSATQGAHRDIIDGVILDSPAIDWNSLLRYQAGSVHIPGAVAGFGIGLLDRGIVRGGEPGGIPFETLAPQVFAQNLDVPVLIHAGEHDTFVPPQPAEQLAGLRPDLVQLRMQGTGEHVKLWNAEPEAWEQVTETFARALPRPPWRG